MKKSTPNYVCYYDDVQEYTRAAQQEFSGSLFLFFILYLAISNCFDFAVSKQFDPTIGVCLLQIALSLFGYMMFRFYFKSHRKYILLAAYFNIFQTIVILEIQYFIYEEFTSYIIIVVIIMASAITVIGKFKHYLFIIIPIIIADTIAIITYDYGNISQHFIHQYIIDAIVVSVFPIGIHYHFSRLKYQDFKLKYELLYLSERDSLTTLLNRKSANSFVQRYAKTNILCAMLIIDIDNFKMVNDTMGHARGDQVLVEIAGKLKDVFRHNDCVSRLGGDEFMIFMPCLLEKNCALKKAQDILEIFPREITENNQTVSISCSIGIAYSQSVESNLYEELYQKADNAMYEAKRNGKGQIKIFDELLIQTFNSKEELINAKD